MLQVGILNGMSTLENSWAVYYKLKYIYINKVKYNHKTWQF